MHALARGDLCELTQLSLHGIVDINDDGLRALVASRSSQSLQCLDINGCKHLTIRTRDQLQQLFPNFKKLIML